MATLSGDSSGRRSGIPLLCHSGAARRAGPGTHIPEALFMRSGLAAAPPPGTTSKLSQPEAAGDDAAQDFAGAALDRDLGRDQRGVPQCFFETVIVAVRVGIAAHGSHQPYLVRQGLLPIGPEILDHG